MKTHVLAVCAINNLIQKNKEIQKEFETLQLNSIVTVIIKPDDIRVGKIKFTGKIIFKSRFIFILDSGIEKLTVSINDVISDKISIAK